MALATEQGFADLIARARVYRGWAMAEQGQLEAGIGEIRQGLAALAATGARAWDFRLAELYGKAGQPEAGLTIITEILAKVDRDGRHHSYVEMQRIKGEMLLLNGAAETEVEARFRRAIEVAQRQEAKSWELRAVMSLCRLLQQQGRGEEGRQLLSEIYEWFTEGFDTLDLIEANALLEELSS